MYREFLVLDPTALPSSRGHPGLRQMITVP
jgi:hypothetical protein